MLVTKNREQLHARTDIANQTSNFSVFQMLMNAPWERTAAPVTPRPPAVAAQQPVPMLKARIPVAAPLALCWRPMA